MGLLLDGAQLPFPNHGHVVLGEPSPTLFYPISSNQVRCLADVPGSKLPSVVRDGGCGGVNMHARTRDQAAAHLRDGVPVAARSLAVL